MSPLATQAHATTGFVDVSVTTRSVPDSQELSLMGNDGDHVIKARDNPSSTAPPLTLGRQSNNDFPNAGRHRASGYAKVRLQTGRSWA